MEERSQSVLEVMELDGGLIGIEDTMDDYWEEEYHFIEKLNHYVWKWAKQIRCSVIGVMKEEIYMRDAKEFWD